MLNVDENYNIYLTRGDSAAFDLEVYENDGKTPYELQTGDRILFTVRRLYDKGEIVVTKDFNTLEFYLLPEDTYNLDTGVYRYDIALYNQNYFITTILAEKTFTLGEEVHDFEQL